MSKEVKTEYHPARTIATNVQKMYVSGLSRDRRETINKGVEGVMKMTPEALKQALSFFTTANVDKTCDKIDDVVNEFAKNDNVRTAMELGDNSVQKVLEVKEYTQGVVQESVDKTTATVKNVWGLAHTIVDTYTTKVQETTEYVLETKDYIVNTSVEVVDKTTKFAGDAKEYLSTNDYSTWVEDGKVKYDEAQEFVGEKYTEYTDYVSETTDAVKNNAVAKVDDAKTYVYGEVQKNWDVAFGFTTETLDTLRVSLNEYLPIAINDKNKNRLLANVNEYYEDVHEKTSQPAYEGMEYVKKHGLVTSAVDTTGFIFHAIGMSRDEKYSPVMEKVKALTKSIFNVRVLIAMGGDDG